MMRIALIVEIPGVDPDDRAADQPASEFHWTRSPTLNGSAIRILLAYAAGHSKPVPAPYLQAMKTLDSLLAEVRACRAARPPCRSARALSCARRRAPAS